MSERITASQDAPELEAEVEAADAEGAEAEETEAEQSEGPETEGTETTSEEAADPTALLEAAEAAGVSMGVARKVIAEKLTLEQAKARFNAVGEIRNVCAQAARINSSIDATKLEAKVFAGDATVEGARKAALTALADASEAADISADIDPDAAAQAVEEPPAKKMVDEKAIFARINTRNQK